MVKPVAKDHRWDGKGEEFLKLFSQKMGDMKIYFGVLNNSIVFIVRDAVSYCQEHNHDYRIKKKIKYIWSWLSMMEYKLKEHQVGYFRPESIAESQRGMFREGVTESDLFEYWVQQAGKPYVMLNKAAGVLKHRFELIFESWGMKDAKAVAYLSTAQWLLEDQNHIFEHCLDVLSETLGLTKGSTRFFIAPFDLKGLKEAVTSLISTIYPESDTRKMNELETHQLELAWDSIEKVLSNPDFLWDGAIEAAADDDTIFRTKGCRKKMSKMVADTKGDFVDNFEL